MVVNLGYIGTVPCFLNEYLPNVKLHTRHLTFLCTGPAKRQQEAGMDELLGQLSPEQQALIQVLNASLKELFVNNINTIFKYCNFVSKLVSKK